MATFLPIALVVCDNVYTEDSGKTALVGLLTRVTATQFPVRYPRLCVYASVSDVRGKTRFRLEIVHSETDERVVSIEGPPAEGADPTTVCDFNFVLRNVEFKEPGLHYVRLWGNGHLLLQRPFEVIQTAGEEEPEGMARIPLIRIGERGIEGEKPQTTFPSHSILVADTPDPSAEQSMRIIEASGPLGFWDRPEEDIYSINDGEPI